jgi:hypothetical protein
MATFLIEFFAQGRGVDVAKARQRPRGAAFIDLEIAEDELSARVTNFASDPRCKHCRGIAVADVVCDLAYELGAAPAGLVEATVTDCSADPRVHDALKGRLLVGQDRLIAKIIDGIDTSGTLH